MRTLLMENPLSIVIFIVIVCTIAYKVGQWVGKIDSERESFLGFVDEIRENLQIVLSRLPVPPDNDRR